MDCGAIKGGSFLGDQPVNGDGGQARPAGFAPIDVRNTTFGDRTDDEVGPSRVDERAGDDHVQGRPQRMGHRRCHGDAVRRQPDDDRVLRSDPGERDAEPLAGMTPVGKSNEGLALNPLHVTMVRFVLEVHQGRRSHPTTAVEVSRKWAPTFVTTCGEP